MRAEAAPHVLIRADASSAIGVGHVMRCLAVAEALAERGVGALFACAELPDLLRARLHEAGFAVTDLAGPAGGAQDLAATAALAHSAAAVILDGYRFGEDYRADLRAAARGPVFAFDDTGALNALHADLIVNPAPDADKLDYPAKAPGAVLLLGPAYAAIRRDIRLAAALAPLEWPARDRILVTFGGSDPLGLTGPVMARLTELLPGVGIDVAVGGGNPRVEALKALAALLGPRIALHIDARHMGELMRCAGLAVAAAGGTAGELAALRTPALLVVIADNQAGAAASLAAAGWPAVEARGGEARGADIARSAESIAQAAADLWRDAPRRCALAAAMADKVDGQGAARIVAALLNKAQSSS